MRWLLALAILAGSVSPVLAQDAAPKMDQGLAGHDRIMARMDALSFPNLKLDNLTIEEVSQLLTTESKKADPAHLGIHFVPRLNPGDVKIKVSVQLKSGSIRQVLGQLQVPMDIAYTVEQSNISLWHDEGEGLSKATFTVPNGFFQVKPDQSLQSFCDVVPQLAARGIGFPAGWSAVYQPSARKLIVVGGADLVENVDYLLFRARVGHK